MDRAYGLKINRRTYLGTVMLLISIMILAGILTLILPQGNYTYIEQDGREIIVSGSYREAEEQQKLPVWRWFTAPAEVLGTGQAVTAVMIMLFILLVGGSFLVLEQSGILSHLMYGVIRRCGDGDLLSDHTRDPLQKTETEGGIPGKSLTGTHRALSGKYRLMGVMVLVCMLLGSTMGLFEETVTLVPITVALALVLGWDSLVGIGMSILSVGFGFAAGTFNPFTLGVTQKLADLPMFSGILFRIVFFLIIYVLLYLFLYRYAKQIETDPTRSKVYEQDIAARTRYRDDLSRVNAGDPDKRRAILFFLAALCLVFAYVTAGFFVPALQEFSMPVMAVLFTAGALISGRIAGLRKGLFSVFLRGMGSIAPSVLLILLAMSVTHIMREGNIIDTILNFFYHRIEGLGTYGGAIALFALVLVLEFFISGSASKAFLLIPIVIPLAEMIGITRQTAVQAFVLGDGFANMLFPTNVVLLITLGIAGIPYGHWFKWTWKLQLALFILSVITVTIAVAIGYGPF